MRIWILSLVLLIAVLIEATFTSIPLVFLILINLLILEKNSWVFAAAFFSGLALDIFSMRFLGSSSLYFVILLFIISLYERRFEANNVYFVLLASFLGSFLYMIVFSERLILQQAVISAFISAFIFYVLYFVRLRKKNLNYLEKEEQNK